MKKSMRMAAILMVLLLTVGGSVLASGTGGGTGGGQDDPLELVASSVTNGAKDVAVDATIRMEFNKNVTFDTVRAGNVSAFSLKDAGGNNVAINVVLAESTNDAEKNFANVKFASPLKNGATYTLTVATSLQSKSGDSLPAPIVITFMTKAAVVSQSSSNPGTGVDLWSLVVVFAALLYVTAYAGVKVYKKRTN